MSRPWMPLYVADYLADTAHLRAAESGAYMHLIMHYWRHGSLPHDDRLLSSIARMTPEEWELAKPLIEPLFKAGPWKHKRVEAELAKTAVRAAAGRKGGNAKAAAKQTSSKTPSDPPSAPVVVLTDNPSPQNELPLASNEGRKVKSGDTRARARPGIRLPKPWPLSGDDREFARSVLPESRIDTEHAKFCDYWHAANGPPSVKRDWAAAWRNWCRKAVEIGGNGYAQHRGIGNGAHHGGDSHAAKAVAAAERAARAAAAFGQVG